MELMPKMHENSNFKIINEELKTKDYRLKG
jgi:hypothetical protein